MGSPSIADRRGHRPGTRGGCSRPTAPLATRLTPRQMVGERSGPGSATVFEVVALGGLDRVGEHDRRRQHDRAQQQAELDDVHDAVGEPGARTRRRRPRRPGRTARSRPAGRWTPAGPPGRGGDGSSPGHRTRVGGRSVTATSLPHPAGRRSPRPWPRARSGAGPGVRSCRARPGRGRPASRGSGAGVVGVEPVEAEGAQLGADRVGPDGHRPPGQRRLDRRVAEALPASRGRRPRRARRTGRGRGGGAGGSHGSGPGPEARSSAAP